MFLSVTLINGETIIFDDMESVVGFGPVNGRITIDKFMDFSSSLNPNGSLMHYDGKVTRIIPYSSILSWNFNSVPGK